MKSLSKSCSLKNECLTFIEHACRHTVFKVYFFYNPLLNYTLYVHSSLTINNTFSNLVRGNRSRTGIPDPESTHSRNILTVLSLHQVLYLQNIIIKLLCYNFSSICEDTVLVYILYISSSIRVVTEYIRNIITIIIININETHEIKIWLQ